MMAEMNFLSLLRNAAMLMTLVFAGFTVYLGICHGAATATFAASTLALAWMAAALLVDNIRLRRQR